MFSGQILMHDDITLLSDEIINTHEDLSSENISSDQILTRDEITAYSNDVKITHLSDENSVLINRGLIQDVTSSSENSSFQDTYSSIGSGRCPSRSTVTEDKLINTPKENIEIQLMEVRNNKHKSFLNAMDNKQMYKNEMSVGVNKNNVNSKWSHNTILITGDSILNNIQEN